MATARGARGGTDAANRRPTRKQPSQTTPVPPTGNAPESFALSTNLLAQTLLEAAPDAILVVNSAGRILFASRQTEVLFGHRRPSLVGQPIELLLPARLRRRHRHHRAAYVADPHTRPMGSGLRLVGRRNDETEFPIEVSLSPLPMGEDLFTIAIVRDISERARLEAVERAAHATIERRQALLQTVLDQLPGAAYLVRGPQAALVMANRTATDVWGVEWPLGVPMADFLRTSGVRYYSENGQPLDPTDLVTLQIVREGPLRRQQREVVRRPDGTQVPILFTAVAMDAALLDSPFQTSLAQGTLSLWDVPERSMTTATGGDKRAEQHTWGAGPSPLGGETGESLSEPTAGGAERAALVLLQDVTLLQVAEQLKDEFVSLAAHELRTPLAAIQGFASMLRVQTAQGRGPELADWQQEAIEEIESASIQLNALIQDLLDVTRIQAGRLELHAVPLDVVALVRRSLTQLQLTTSKHTLSLEAPAEPVVLTGDRLRLEQVLGNLVGNAIKYSPDGGPIRVAVRVDPDVGQAEVRIRDQGIGIPADEQARMFQRFARASNVHDHGIAGSGLGLFVCRELVERHGGNLWFESTEGEGTTFCLVLPLAAEVE